MRKFGLIGYPLTHSFSQRYFTDKFQREDIRDCIYTAFPIPSIDRLTAILTDNGLSGLNVTIPYKEQVLPFLRVRSEVVQSIGACNCIRIRDGVCEGFNTDVVGFERSLLSHLKPTHTKALVLGTGGAAKAVEYVLNKLGIVYRLVSRKPVPGSGQLGYEEVDGPLLLSHTLLINTTPVGMYPNVQECPPLPYEAVNERHYLFDLVYNPERTLFLQKGAERGALVENGYSMLVIQAEESWKIWNP